MATYGCGVATYGCRVATYGCRVGTSTLRKFSIGQTKGSAVVVPFLMQLGSTCRVKGRGGQSGGCGLCRRRARASKAVAGRPGARPLPLGVPNTLRRAARLRPEEAERPRMRVAKGPLTRAAKVCGRQGVRATRGAGNKGCAGDKGCG